MARTPKKTKKTEAEVEQLIAAVNFVSEAAKTRGLDYQDHFIIKNKCLMAFDGTLAAGAIIQEDLHAYPNIKQLCAAIQHCKSASALSQISPSLLRVTSAKFRANIACIEEDKMQNVWPDVPTVGINQDLIDALIVAGNVVTDSAEFVIQCAVKLSDYSVDATDRAIAVQIWHGVPLNGQTFSVPKMFINLLHRTKKVPVWLGYSNNSLTIFYDDNSWYKTQLYDTVWPPIDRVFDNVQRTTFGPVAPDFFEAIGNVRPFTKNDIIYLVDNMVMSHTEAEVGAFQTVGTNFSGFKTSVKHLVMLEKFGITELGIYNVPEHECLYANGAVKPNMPIRVAISGME